MKQQAVETRKPGSWSIARWILRLYFCSKYTDFLSIWPEKRTWQSKSLRKVMMIFPWSSNDFHMVFTWFSLANMANESSLNLWDGSKDAETFGIAGGVDPRQREALAPGQSHLVIDSAVVPAACTQHLGYGGYGLNIAGLMNLACTLVKLVRLVKLVKVSSAYWNNISCTNWFWMILVYFYHFLSGKANGSTIRKLQGGTSMRSTCWAWCTTRTSWANVWRSKWSAMASTSVSRLHH